MILFYDCKDTAICNILGGIFIQTGYKLYISKRKRTDITTHPTIFTTFWTIMLHDFACKFSNLYVIYPQNYKYLRFTNRKSTSYIVVEHIITNKVQRKRFEKRHNYFQTFLTKSTTSHLNMPSLCPITSI